MNAEQAAKILGITILSFRSLVVNKKIPRTGMLGGTGIKGGYSVNYDKKFIIDMAIKKYDTYLSKTMYLKDELQKFGIDVTEPPCYCGVCFECSKRINND